MDHAIFRLHHGAVGSLNVYGQENAEISTLLNSPKMTLEVRHLALQAA